MRSQNTLIHIEIGSNVHTQCIFSGWGNKILPEKICTDFVSGIHPHLTPISFYFHLLHMIFSTTNESLADLILSTK